MKCRQRLPPQLIKSNQTHSMLPNMDRKKKSVYKNCRTLCCCVFNVAEPWLTLIDGQAYDTPHGSYFFAVFHSTDSNKMYNLNFMMWEIRVGKKKKQKIEISMRRVNYGNMMTCVLRINFRVFIQMLSSQRIRSKKKLCVYMC